MSFLIASIGVEIDAVRMSCGSQTSPADTYSSDSGRAPKNVLQKFSANGRTISRSHALQEGR